MEIDLAGVMVGCGFGNRVTNEYHGRACHTVADLLNDLGNTVQDDLLV